MLEVDTQRPAINASLMRIYIDTRIADESSLHIIRQNIIKMSIYEQIRLIHRVNVRIAHSHLAGKESA